MNGDTKILTFHFCENFGAVMQAFALREAVAQISGRAELVDYRPWRDLDKYHDPGVRSLFRRKEEKFAAFRWSHMGIQGNGFTQLTRDNAPEAHAFIVGSDQVWNPLYTEYDDAYFLRFAHQDAKKISYAASIGLPSRHPMLQPEVYRSRLWDFDFISVREREHADYLERLLSRRIQVTVDPVLLLDGGAYEAMADSVPKRGDRYVVLYDFAFSPPLIEDANRLARRLGCSVVHFYAGAPEHLFYGASDSFAGDGVEEMLSCFRHAQAVISSSYHGVMFALLFRKDFYVPRGAYAGVRLGSFLDAHGLENRVMDDACSPVELTDAACDRVHRQIREEREQSLAFLKEALR